MSGTNRERLCTTAACKDASADRTEITDEGDETVENSKKIKMDQRISRGRDEQ